MKLNKVEIDGQIYIEDENGNINKPSDYLYDYISNLFFIEKFPDTSENFKRLNEDYLLILEQFDFDIKKENWEEVRSIFTMSTKYKNKITGEIL